VADRTPVVLVHVEEPEAGLMGRDFAETELRAGAKLVSEWAQSVSERGIEVSTSLLDGAVVWALADFVRPDDLLVVGTHKTGFLHGRVLGSRSVQIAAAARSSVAVIPELDLRFRRGVVVGIDQKADAPDVACAAAAEATAYGVPLSVIRAFRVAPQPREAHGSAAVAAVRKKFPDLAVRTRESQREPAEALLDAARDKALLVIGPGRSERSPIGSVLHDILLNLNAPTLVARRVKVAGEPGEQGTSDPVATDDAIRH
jgi:nucleotide-binding universal stress UspA family protein